MSKGGQTQRQTTTTTSTMDPYTRSMIESYFGQVGGLPTGGSPLLGTAGLTPDQLASYDVIRNQGLTGSNYLGMAGDIAGQVSSMQLPTVTRPEGSNFDLGAFAKEYLKPINVGAGSATAGQIDPSQIASNLGLFRSALGAAPTAEASQAAAFMGAYQNPYTDQVINATMGDMDRARRLALSGVADQATASGAFGGSRHGLVEAETNRNYLEQAGRLAADLRNTGFQTALSAGQGDAANQLAARLQNAQIASQYGLTPFSTAANLAGQQAGLNTQAGIANAQNATQASVAGGQIAAQQQQLLGNLALGFGGLSRDYAGLGLQADIANQQGALGLGNLGLGAGGLYAGLGPTAQSLIMNYAGALGGAGQEQQQNEQARQAAIYQQAMQNFGLPYQNLQMFGQALPMLGQYGTTTQMTEEQRQRSLLQSIAGGAMSGFGMFGPWGALGGGLLGAFL